MPRAFMSGSICEVYALAPNARSVVELMINRTRDIPMAAKDEALNVMELFPYGIYVMAAAAGENVAAIIATWVTQVSFVPPLVAVAVEKEGSFLEQILAAKQFSLSLLPEDGIETAKYVLKNGPLFPLETKGLPFVNGENAPPRPAGAHSTINCRIRETYPAGDHVIMVGEITGAKAQGSGPVLTLLDTGWKYRRKGQASEDTSPTD
jgi:flavin reductase (DIM6/NTAB) family NADH-FMN oxidoreductase RutF